MTEEKRKRILDLTHELCREMNGEPWGVLIDALNYLLDVAGYDVKRDAIVGVLNSEHRLSYSDLVRTMQEQDYARGEDVEL